MMFSTVLTVVSLVATVSARRLCASNRSQAEIRADNEAIKDVFPPESIAPIETYVHVITSDSGSGDITDAVVRKQMDVMNDDFRQSGFEFKLIDITRTAKSSYRDLRPDSSAENSMKRTLRKGNNRTLNVYLTSLTDGLLGWATFPNAVGSNLSDDGVVVLDSSVPGGSSAPYNGGRTLTHEVGHWLGLYHTFQGGCGSPGDSVSDTPPVARPNYGCPKGSDSCRGGGRDLIENFMDYTDDACMNSFTSGQADRMAKFTARYRS